MQGAGKFAVLLLLLFSAHPAAGEDEHKLGKMLHRQAQDIPRLMSDVKTIIMRQDSQQQDIATLMSDGKTIIMRHDSQQQDIATLMSDGKTILMRQNSQQQDLAQLMTDVKSIKFHHGRELRQQQEEAEDIAQLMTDVKTQQQDLAQLMTDVKTLITFHEQQEQEEAERRGIRDICTRSRGLTTLLVHDHPITIPCDDGAVFIHRRIDNAGCTMTSLGKEYEGTIAVTKSGKTCQAWAAQSPHTHSYSASNLPEGNFADAVNYCRNPDSDSGGLWCLTMDPAKKWEYCDVPLCPSVAGCKKTCLGKEYDGAIAVTKSGKRCQRWAAQSPHEHTQSASYFPEGNFADAVNYCRNPESDSGGPWCYTTDPGVRWEYCDVPQCTI